MHRPFYLLFVNIIGSCVITELHVVTVLRSHKICFIDAVNFVCVLCAGSTFGSDSCVPLARSASPSQEVIAHRLKLLDPR